MRNNQSTSCLDRPLLPSRKALSQGISFVFRVPHQRLRTGICPTSPARRHQFTLLQRIETQPTLRNARHTSIAA